MKDLQIVLEKISNLEQAVLSLHNEALSREQAAKALNCSPRTLSRLQSEGKIAYCKSGGNITFLRSDIIGYLNSVRVPSVSEIEQRRAS